MDYVKRENDEVKAKVEKLMALEEPFTDPEFPPNIQSLGGKPELWKGVEWKRVGEVFKHPKIFSDGIDYGDI